MIVCACVRLCASVCVIVCPKCGAGFKMYGLLHSEGEVATAKEKYRMYGNIKIRVAKEQRHIQQKTAIDRHSGRKTLQTRVKRETEKENSNKNGKQTS